jgi:hypothetical protein
VSRCHCRGDEGSIHPLMLAMALVVALAVVVIRDIGTVGLTRWQAMQAAENAADSAAQGIDEAHYQSTGEPRLDPARARELAAASLQRDELMTAFSIDGDQASVAVARRPRTILIPADNIEEAATSRLEVGVTEPVP